MDVNFFDTQTIINDCSFNELIFSLSEAGLLKQTFYNDKYLTTTYLEILLGNGIVQTFGAN